MKIKMRPFLELLPYRLDHALVSPRLRKALVKRRRAQTLRVSDSSSETFRRLFVDMSVISKHDAGTGIQRVVRSLASSLIDEAAIEGWDVQFVAASRRHAYRRISWPDSNVAIPSHEIAARPGDIFVGLDYSLDAIRQHAKQLARFRRDGGKLWFLVHDLLPLERPDWFGRNTGIRYKAWLDIMAGVADGFLCNSPQTEAQLRNVLDREYGLTTGYVTNVLPMGFRILDTGQNHKIEDVTTVRRPNTNEPFFLMVGTLEPRKGHADIIAAFDVLWQAGMPYALVLVGRLGWQVDDLRSQILSHPLLGSKLFWFDDVDDVELERMYAASQGSIIASYAEGFGLPLIEALGHGRPVLARDLPIFRPHEDYGTRYFPPDANTAALAQGIKRWIDDIRSNRIQVVTPSTTWQQSARDLLLAIA